MHHLKMLVRYKAWANALFFDRASTLSHQQLTAPQPITFGSLIRTLNHVYVMDTVWKSNLLGIDHGLTTRNPTEHPDFQTLRRDQEVIDSWFVGYSDSLPDEEADQEIEFQFIGGGKGRMNRRDIILHVVNHATYHRGHAADMLYHFNVSPPTTDLPVYIREFENGA